MVMRTVAVSPGPRRSASGVIRTRCRAKPRAWAEKYSAREPRLVTRRVAVPPPRITSEDTFRSRHDRPSRAAAIAGGAYVQGQTGLRAVGPTCPAPWRQRRGSGERPRGGGEHGPDDRGRPVVLGAEQRGEAADAGRRGRACRENNAHEPGTAPSTPSPTATTSGLSSVERESPEADQPAARAAARWGATPDDPDRGAAGGVRAQRVSRRPSRSVSWTVGTLWKSSIDRPGPVVDQHHARRRRPGATASDLSTRPMPPRTHTTARPATLRGVEGAGAALRGRRGGARRQRRRRRRARARTGPTSRRERLGSA